MNSTSTRLANIDDFECIYVFVCDLENATFDKDAMRRCYYTCLAGTNNYYFVALENETPIGYLSCHGQVLMHHCGMVYEIEELYVLPAYRNRGIGKLLLHTLERHLDVEPYALLEVASNIKRVDAHRFYETNGFDKNTFRFMKLPKVESKTAQVS